MSDGKSSSSAAAAIDYQEIHDALVQIALQAGEMITSAQPAVSGHGTKKDNSADLVTETDQAVEKMIMEELGRKYPGFECVWSFLFFFFSFSLFGIWGGEVENGNENLRECPVLPKKKKM